MIAARFRIVVWAAAVAFAALACYLVSLRVAAERAQATRLDAALAAAHSDIRDLATELGTRSRLVQLERWNADVLALTAPKAAQYLAGEMQLASYAATGAEPATPAAQALQPTPQVARVAYARVRDLPATRLLHSVSLSLDDGQPALRRVALVHAGAALGVDPRGALVRP